MAAVVAVGLVACRREAAAPAVDGPIGVSVQQVRIETLRDVFSASGTVVPSPAAELMVTAPDGAQVAELPKKEGDTVATGDLLVRFEIPSLAQELAARELAVADAAARVSRAKTDLTRLSGLFDRGIAPRATLDAARAELSAAESQHGQAVTQLRTAALETEQASIRARFPGIVTRVFHTEGEFVRADNDPVLQVIDPTRYQILLDLPIAQLARVVPGQAAVVRPIGAVGEIAATVALKAAVTDPNAPTGQVRLTLSDATGLEPNAPVSAEILLDQRTNVLVIPAAALLRDDLSAFVMVAGDDRRAHRRDVRAGLRTPQLVEITAGLQAGERVVTTGAVELADGAPIAFVE